MITLWVDAVCFWWDTVRASWFMMQYLSEKQFQKQGLKILDKKHLTKE